MSQNIGNVRDKRPGFYVDFLFSCLLSSEFIQPSSAFSFLDSDYCNKENKKESYYNDS